MDSSEQVVTPDPAVMKGLDAWRSLPIKQQPQWDDPEALAAVSAELTTAPPLVFAGEVDMLRERLARVARGEAFLLQGGDCAETFCWRHSRPNSQPSQDDFADGCGLDLRRLDAHHQNGQNGGPVRETSLE